MSSIAFTVNFTLPGNPTDPPACVMFWYGVRVIRNCFPSGTNSVQNWHKSCVNNITPGVPTNYTFNFPLAPGEEQSMCNYVVDVYAQPCCFTGIDCSTQPYPDNPLSLAPGSYTNTTFTLPPGTNKSNCRRYYIGAGTNGLYPPNAIIRYTPCFTTQEALCNNNSYNSTLQTFAIPTTPQGNPLQGYIITSQTTDIDLLQPHIRVIELCSSTPVEVGYLDQANNFVPYTLGTDYTQLVVENNSLNRCCHNCIQYYACADNIGRDNAIAIVQDCINGLLVTGSLVSGSFSRCVIAGHVFPLAPNVTICTGCNSANVVVNGPISCNIQAPTCGQQLPNDPT